MRLFYTVRFTSNRPVTLGDLRLMLDHISDAPADVVPIIQIDDPVRSFEFAWISPEDA
jgi:hypothetical protein